MDQVGGVDEVHAAQRVVQEGLQMLLVELDLFSLLHDLAEVRLYVLHHDEDVRYFLTGVNVDVRGDDIVDQGREYVPRDRGQFAQDLNLANQLL